MNFQAVDPDTTKLNSTKYTDFKSDVDQCKSSNLGGKALSFTSGAQNIDSTGIITQIDQLNLDIEAQTIKIKKRLVSTEHSFDPIALRP